MTHWRIPHFVGRALSGVIAGSVFSMISGLIVAQSQVMPWARLSWGLPIAIFIVAVVAAVRTTTDERPFYIAFGIAFIVFPIVAGAAVMMLLAKYGCC